MGSRFCQIINNLNDWVGKIFGWLIIPLMLLVVFDVILRYIFNRPTIWVWDINVQLLGTLVVLGGGYALRHGAHIGVDALVGHLSPPKRAMVDLITSFFFFFGVGVLMWKATMDAIFSVQIKELYTSVFAPPIYPFKILMVLGILLLFLQGVVKFIQDLNLILKKESKNRQ
jgi:TRAP-type mannitol/chloroaromatic compound transport system permease small subunit